MPEFRAQLRCALPDFDRTKWHLPQANEHMGGPEDHQGHKPGESTEEGCPGSWYRCNYIYSLVRYQRHRDANGSFTENLSLTRCKDPRVLEAIHHLEQERIRCSNYLDEKRLGNR